MTIFEWGSPALRSQNCSSQHNAQGFWFSNPFPWDITKGNSTVENRARFSIHCNIFYKCKQKHFIKFIVCYPYAGLLIWIDWFNEKFKRMKITKRKSIHRNTISTERRVLLMCGVKTSYFRSSCLVNMQIPGPHPIVYPWPLNFNESLLLSRILSHQSILTAVLPLVYSNQGWRDSGHDSFTLCIPCPGWSSLPL